MNVVNGHGAAPDQGVYFFPQLEHRLGVLHQVVHDERKHACQSVNNDEGLGSSRSAYPTWSRGLIKDNLVMSI